MDITCCGAIPSKKGPVATFTGTVRMDMPFAAIDPGQMVGVTVTFEPNARTFWHTHPLGQTLLVTSGIGWVCYWGGKRQEIRAGDIVSIAPNEKHWHGGTTENAMTHIAISEKLNGSNVTWMEEVTDEQYAG